MTAAFANLECDVAVVGAGPAGALAALHLARAGVDVVLLERAELPRYKACGGGLVERARKSLEIDVSGAIEHVSRRAEVSFELGARRFEVTREPGIVHMAMRAELDRLLVTAACEAGASLRSPCDVLDLRQSDSHVVLETSGGQLRSRFVVAADGAQSLVARRAGWETHTNLAPALEAEVTVDPESFERLSRSARFDFDLPPGGYAWVFPKRAHLSIGVVRMRRGAARLNEALQSYLDQLAIGRVLSIERHGWTIPLAPRPDGIARGRVLLVGDAAGLADPLTGEGIGPALESGRLAAQALVQTALEPRRAAALYARRARRTLLRELRAGRRLARLVYRHPRLRALAFRLYGRALVEAMTDTVMGETSYVALARSPRAYLRLLEPRSA